MPEIIVPKIIEIGYPFFQVTIDNVRDVFFPDTVYNTTTASAVINYTQLHYNLLLGGRIGRPHSLGDSTLFSLFRFTSAKHRNNIVSYNLKRDH